MMSLSVIRNAAVLSVKRQTRFAPSLMHYTTENNGKEEVKAEGKEEPKIEVELTEETKKLLAEKDKKIAELKDAYLRCLADQENLRERSRKELETTKEFAIQKFAKDLLDTVDILNMALTAVPSEFRAKESASNEKSLEKVVDQLTNLYTGVSMTESELIKALNRHGVERFDPQGEAFDHNRHQALFQAPMPDKEPGTVFVVQKMGYTLKGRTLRAAAVGVVADAQ